ncbi:sarcosine oxidase subunit gamma [Pontibaca methylaminivorans]|uniref:sarcosine oxidase subunit gamma n=1 Tax=Pontibaca methylaminivorans TaxID=515897 RepID=UPI002FD8ABD6
MAQQNQDSAGVVIEQTAPQARFSLRVRPERREALAAVLGLDLPERIGTRATAEAGEALCLGPDEWLVIARDGAALTQTARAGEIPHSLSDISDREISLRLSGPGVLGLLSAGCPRDLASIPPGGGARTLFESATVVLWRDGETDFRMDIWRSFTPQVRSILEQARADIAAGL